jgi:hypothetical protein
LLKSRKTTTNHLTDAIAGTLDKHTRVHLAPLPEPTVRTLAYAFCAITVVRTIELANVVRTIIASHSGRTSTLAVDTRTVATLGEAVIGTCIGAAVLSLPAFIALATEQSHSTSKIIHI